MVRSNYRILLSLLTSLMALLCCAAMGICTIDVTPRTLLYADFNSPQCITADREQCYLSVNLAEGKIGTGELVARGAGVDSRNVHFGAGRFDPRRGSLAFWIKANNDVIDGNPELLSITQGPLYLQRQRQAAAPGPRRCDEDLARRCHGHPRHGRSLAGSL